LERAAIIATRRRLLRAAKNLLVGQEPPEAGEAAQYTIRALDVILPRTAVWEEAAQAAMSADKPWLAVAV